MGINKSKFNWKLTLRILLAILIGMVIAVAFLYVLDSISKGIFLKALDYGRDLMIIGFFGGAALGFPLKEKRLILSLSFYCAFGFLLGYLGIILAKVIFGDTANLFAGAVIGAVIGAIIGGIIFSQSKDKKLIIYFSVLCAAGMGMGFAVWFMLWSFIGGLIGFAISGAVMGAAFGFILKFKKAIIYFSASCATGYALGFTVWYFLKYTLGNEIFSNITFFIVIAITVPLLFPSMFFKPIKDYNNDFYVKMAELEPDNPDILNSLGVHYDNLEDYDKAIEYYEKAIKLNGNYYHALYNLGRVYNIKEDYDKAIEYYNKSLQINPDNDYVWYLLGGVYKSKGNYDKAEEYFNKSLQINPESDDALTCLGQVYENNKLDYDKAIGYYVKALKLNPKNVFALNCMGSVYIEKEEYSKAKEYLDKAISIDPDYFCPKCELGSIYEKRDKDYESALRLYQEALEKYPDCSQLNFNIGKILLETNRKEYSEYFGKAYELLKDDLSKKKDPMSKANLCEMLGIISLHREKKDEAKEYFEKAIKYAGECDKVYSDDLGKYVNSEEFINECKEYIKKIN